MSCHVTLRSTHVLEQEEVEALHNVWGEATFQRQGALAAAKSLLLHSRSPLADRWATHLHSGAKAVGSGGLAEVGWLVFFFGGVTLFLWLYRTKNNKTPFWGYSINDTPMSFAKGALAK